MRVFLVACLAITSLTASCSDADPPSESDDNATSRSDAGERRFVDAGTSGARFDASTAADAGPGDNEGNGGEDSLDEGCAATTLDEGVACQIAANDAYVAAFCDCFTASAYAGDRAACEAEQPNASDFAIPACPRAALMAYEEESTAHAVCYAAAVEELAECMAQCPGDQEAFDACTAPLGPAFDACDTLLPEPLVYALGQCEEPGGPVGPGDGDGSSGDGAPTVADRTIRAAPAPCRPRPRTASSGLRSRSCACNAMTGWRHIAPATARWSTARWAHAATRCSAAGTRVSALARRRRSGQI